MLVAYRLAGSVGRYYQSPRRRRVQFGAFTNLDAVHVPLAVRHQHDFAEHAAFAQHLVRATRLFEW
jgi:hypothetical protein